MSGLLGMTRKRATWMTRKRCWGDTLTIFAFFLRLVNFLMFVAKAIQERYKKRQY
ncbi:hypothetical protein HET73_00125 [Wolbachia endosymbiont of Atemnus politus]|nr:hypothetical protein [Wolbachia endosymbiont of Atemnus politus]